MGVWQGGHLDAFLLSITVVLVDLGPLVNQGSG